PASAPSSTCPRCSDSPHSTRRTRSRRVSRRTSRAPRTVASDGPTTRWTAATSSSSIRCSTSSSSRTAPGGPSARPGRWSRPRRAPTSGHGRTSGRRCRPGCAVSASPIPSTAGWSADTGSSTTPRTAARAGSRFRVEPRSKSMSAGETNEQDKRALYWLGERLIDYRHPIMIVVLGVTAVFAYWAFQLKLETSFGDLLPQTHPFVQIHNKYAGTFGGANNVQLMVEVKDGDIFTVPTLARIYKITEAVDQ